MKLKRFVAADARTAMQQIKATFGPDAVILSSHQVKEGVEVVAAIDFDETILTRDAAIASAEPPSSKGNEATGSATPLDDMRQEIQTLRGMLEAQLKGSSGLGEPLHALLIQKLYSLGASPSMAMRLAQSVNAQLNQNQAWKLVLAQLSEQLPLCQNNRIEEGGIYAFVGPTGVGKTTTLAKIAARFAIRFGAENLGLVTMDTYRIAAQEQLVLYGKIIGVNVNVARDDASLGRIMSQLSDKKLILIDTAGMNPADERVTSQMQVLSRDLQSISTVLVLSATNHYQALNDAIRRYKSCDVNQCILTKLDESIAIGGALSAIIETSMPVSYLTHGQRVPEDIKIATRHHLIDLLTQQDHTLSKPIVDTRKTMQDVGREFYVEN